MPEYKKQHYIPQQYLERFALKNEYNTFEIYYYDKNKQEFGCKSPKNIAYENYYYSSENKNNEKDHKLEKFFGQIENEFKPLVNKIIETSKLINKKKFFQPFSDNDKELICLYLYSQFLRVPKLIDKIEKDIIEMVDEVEDERTLKNLRNYSLEKMIEGVDLNPIEAFFSKNVFIYFFTNDKTNYITSDSPILYHENKGFKNSCVYFPLTSNLMIYLTEEEGNGFGFKKANNHRDIIRKANIDTAKYAYRYIFSNNELLLKKILKTLNLHY